MRDAKKFHTAVRKARANGTIDIRVSDNYLIPHYDVLHSLGSNAIIEDMTGYIRERGLLL